MKHILALAVVLAACCAVQAQGDRPATGKVESAIRAGKHEVALLRLDRLLKKSPTDLSLLRARMNILLSLEHNQEALACAKQLLKALPSGLEATALQTLKELLERKAIVLKHGEFQEVLEKAELYCVARDAIRLLGVLEKLEKRSQDDPVFHLALGEIYSSTGTFKRAKATAAFQKFMALTTDAKLKGGAPPSESPLADPLRTLSTLQQGADLHAVRLRIHKYLDQLKQGYRLLLMTDPAWIVEWKSQANRKRNDAENCIREALNELARLRRLPRMNRQFNKRGKAAELQFYKDVIKREKKYAQEATEELELLENGLRKVKGSRTPKKKSRAIPPRRGRDKPRRRRDVDPRKR